jgi:hypothetical protein
MTGLNMSHRSGPQRSDGEMQMQLPNKRIEPITSSASVRLLQSDANDALLVMAHPHCLDEHAHYAGDPSIK